MTQKSKCHNAEVKRIKTFLVCSDCGETCTTIEVKDCQHKLPAYAPCSLVKCQICGDFMDATEVQEPETEDKWISVEDRLPDFDKKVLVFGEEKAMNPQMGGAYICFSVRQDLSKTGLKHQADRYQCDNQFKLMRYVTHWQPLPQKPKRKL